MKWTLWCSDEELELGHSFGLLSLLLPGTTCIHTEYIHQLYILALCEQVLQSAARLQHVCSVSLIVQSILLQLSLIEAYKNMHRLLSAAMWRQVILDLIWVRNCQNWALRITVAEILYKYSQCMKEITGKYALACLHWLPPKCVHRVPAYILPAAQYFGTNIGIVFS